MRWLRSVFDRHDAHGTSCPAGSGRIVRRGAMTTTPKADGFEACDPGAAARAIGGWTPALLARKAAVAASVSPPQRWCTQHRTPGVMTCSLPFQPLRAERRMPPARPWRLHSCAFYFALEAADALAHPAFRAPSLKGGGNEDFGRPRAVITTGVMALVFARTRGLFESVDMYLHLAPLAGRGRKLSAAKFSGEGLARERQDAPHPLAPLATSPRQNGAR